MKRELTKRGERMLKRKVFLFFLLVAMKNNEVLAEEIIERDEGALNSKRPKATDAQLDTERSKEEKTAKGTGQGNVHERQLCHIHGRPTSSRLRRC
ncbi:hypothetical protein OIU76_009736 [Salix suchowensis]|nr:hypothetical protein OIU76_009736 [Salix suchowensis]